MAGLLRGKTVICVVLLEHSARISSRKCRRMTPWADHGAIHRNGPQFRLGRVSGGDMC